MPEDQYTELLLRRVNYLERALALNKEDYLRKKESYDAIIKKLKAMINNGEITTYLGIDAVYCHLLEKFDLGKEEIDKYAQEIRDFIA